MRINKTFFNYFNGYDLKEVANSVLALSDEEKNVILSIWGESSNIEINDEAKRIIYRLKKELGKQCLMDKLDCYDDKLIKQFLTKLNKKAAESILKEYYINEPCPKQPLSLDEIETNEFILSKVKLYNDGLSIKYRNFFYPFKNYKKEEIIRIVNLLPKYERELLYKKYGKDLLNTDYNKDLTKEENTIINTIVIPKIKTWLKKINDKTAFIVRIEDIYPNTSKEMIKIRSTYLNVNDRMRLFLVFGEDLNEEVIVNKKVLNALNNIKVRKIIEDEKIIALKEKKIVSKDEKNSEIIIKTKAIRRLSYMKKYQSLINYYDENTALAIMSVLYLDDEISNSELMVITGINKDYIYKLIETDEKIFSGISYKRQNKVLRLKGENNENK